MRGDISALTDHSDWQITPSVPDFLAFLLRHDDIEFIGEYVERSNSVALPVLQALLLADHVYQDQGTGKFIICGVFNTLFFTPSAERPTGEAFQVVGPEAQTAIAKLRSAGSPWAYFSLTELNSEMDFELRYVDLSEDPESNALFSIRFKLKGNDPLATIECTMALPNLPISKEEEGVYSLELLCDNSLLGSHRVLLKQHPTTK